MYAVAWQFRHLTNLTASALLSFKDAIPPIHFLGVSFPLGLGKTMTNEHVKFKGQFSKSPKSEHMFSVLL